jgi:hypothetical protein
MNFHLSVWDKYRREAGVIGNHIASYQDKKTRVIHLDKDALDGYVAHITCILLECSNYMDKCGLTRPSPLWKYNAKDPTTQPSSVAFKYKDRMTPAAIKKYDEGFMSEPIKETKKKAA